MPAERQYREGSHRQIRIASYNVHKCRGFDRRTMPDRIADVLHEIDADILCLQEVVNSSAQSLFDQVRFLEQALPHHHARFGANRPLAGGTYGNLTLSRLPFTHHRNHDVTAGREPRGVLQTDVAMPGGGSLHVFNVHLGTGYVERRHQARRLVSTALLNSPSLAGPRLVIGDFNEWTRGLTTNLLSLSFESARAGHALRFPRTYPGILPVLTLDHCYFEQPLQLVSTQLWRSRTALVASDHLPLVATFQIAH